MLNYKHSLCRHMFAVVKVIYTICTLQTIYSACWGTELLYVVVVTLGQRKNISHITHTNLNNLHFKKESGVSDN